MNLSRLMPFVIALSLLASISALAQRRVRTRTPKSNPASAAKPKSVEPAGKTAPSPTPMAGDAADVSRIISKAEGHFNEGKRLLARKELPNARGSFDRAVDSILEAHIDVRSIPHLQRYYLELVEKIYRLEVPTPLGSSRIGFVEQRFDPAPKDELSLKGKGQPPTSASEPFDLSQEKLPVGYAGHDIQAIYQRLSEFEKITKGEFEKTPDYQLRVEQEKAKPIVGNLKRDSLFAISVGHEIVSQLEATYDADKEVMKVRLNGTRMIDRDDVTVDEDRRALTYKLEGSQRRSLLEGKDIYVTGLALSNGRCGEKPIEIRMDVPKAQRVKPNLRALVIFRLREPATFDRVYTSEPSTKRPYETRFFDHYVDADLVTVWFYDISTGEVFARLPCLTVDYSRPFRQTEVTQKARITYMPDPKMTEEASKAAKGKATEWIVRLRMVFAATGQVTNISVVQSQPYGLTERAIEAAKQIKFVPAKLNGRTVSQYAVLEYKYKVY